MFTDSELLRQYVKDGSEAAFTELVHRYGALVYSAALRSTNGNGHLAEEITQDVFILLVRKAPRLVRHETLAGWLHTTTRYVTLRALHKLRTREIREQEAVAMQTISTPEIQWEQLRPLLDEAVGQLDDPDRNAVLLRYFQGASHREVGVALGLNEDAARMRTERAVEKLHRHFARSGVITSAALLAEALAMNSVQATPPGLIGKVATNSFAHGRTLGLGHAFLKALYMTTTTKMMITAAVIAAAFATGWVGAEHAGNHASPPAKAVVGNGTPAKNSALSSADLLAQAKADLAKLLHIPGSLIRQRAVLDFVENLDAGTAKALLDDYATKPLTVENKEALSDLAYRWAELEPDAAVAWLQNLADPNVQNACATNIFDAYSAKDPAAALDALAQLPPSLNYTSLVVPTINNFARQDPRAALAALQSLPNRQKFQTSIFIIFQVWAEMDPTTAATEALKLPNDYVQRTASLASVARSWAGQDPAAAMAWINTLPDGLLKSSTLRGVIQGVSQQDPAAAADYFLNLPPDSTPVSSSLLAIISQSWMSADPAALLAWAHNNLTGTDYDTTAVDALQQMVSTDPAAVATYLAQNPDPNITKDAVPSLAAVWGQQDPLAALTWAESLPDENTTLRNSAINGVVSSWSSMDPGTAATYIQQNLATDPIFSSLATQVVRSWGNTDAQAAFTWAENLPPGTAQNNAVVKAITALAKVDTQTVASAAAQKAMGQLAGLTPAQQTTLQSIAEPPAGP